MFGKTTSLALFVGLAQLASPVRSTSCVYEWTNPDTNQGWTWDFSSLQSTQGYTIEYPISWNGTDYPKNSFNINLCTNSPVECLPEGYAADSQTGVAVQSWGTTPQCQYDGSTKICEQGASPTVRGKCCTSPCTVLSDNPEPEAIAPYDISKLGQGTTDDGVVLTFESIADPNTDKSLCEFGTPTMAVQYTLFCSTEVVFESVEVLQNGCEFNIVAESKYACSKQVSPDTTTSSTTPAPNTMSGGSVFLLILFIVAVLYFGLGTIIFRFVSGSWQIPNKVFWVSFGGFVGEGARFIIRGCKRDPTGGQVATNGYIDEDKPETDYVAATDNEFSTSNNAAASKDELYDDL
mgnify:CR=1 FL=1